LDIRLPDHATHRASDFALSVEKLCAATVESGDMTRDLAILVRADHPWLTTNQFLDPEGDALADRRFWRGDGRLRWRPRAMGAVAPDLR
jgi:hypothetical protein